MEQRPSITQQFEQTLSDQDTMQRTSMCITVALELYRMLVSTLLILFVPQNCEGHVCSLNENLIWSDSLYNASISFNFLTLCVFITLYGVEITRENKMIDYLEVNPQQSRHNTDLQKVFAELPAKYHDRIYWLDKLYQRITYLCIGCFSVNTILSGIVIYKFSLGNQTTTTFVTNVLFMTTKIYDTYYIANTESSIFYSAYLREKVQFNDIDPSIREEMVVDASTIDASLTLVVEQVPLGKEYVALSEYPLEPPLITPALMQENEKKEKNEENEKKEIVSMDSQNVKV